MSITELAKEKCKVTMTKMMMLRLRADETKPTMGPPST
jgi:hypothetical protein